MACLAAIGNGNESAIRKQGVVSSIFDDLKTALHATPQLAAEATNETKEHTQPMDLEETRAVLQVKMRGAMERQDAQLVQELARQLDRLDYGQPQGASTPVLHAPTMASVQQMAPPMPSVATRESRSRRLYL